MAILTAEEWAARLAERERRYAAQAEPSEPLAPAPAPAPSIDLTGFAKELSETLRTALDEVRPEIAEAIALLEHERNSIQGDSEEIDMANEMQLNDAERRLVEQFRELQAAQTARAALSKQEQDEIARLDEIAVRAMSKKGVLTEEETGALRSRIAAVLGEMNGARSS